MPPATKREKPTPEEVLRDAKLREETGAKWSVEHVAAILGINRRTVYRTRWLMAIKETRATSGACWDPKKVRLRHSLQQRPDALTAATNAATFRATG